MRTARRALDRLGARGLRWRLTTGYVAILVLALIAVGASQYFALRSFLENTLASELRSQAHYAVEARGGPARALADPEALARSASTPDARAGVYSGSGAQLAVGPAGPRAVPWMGPAGSSPISSFPAGGYELLRGADTTLLAVTAPVDKPRSAFILIEGSTSGIDAILRGDVLIFTGAGLVAILVASLLGAGLTGRAVGRLAVLSTAAAEISSGDLRRRAQVGGHDEIAQLGAAFDDMVQRLEQEIVRRDETEAAMRRFLADASHELRTPLTALGVGLDVLGRGAIADPNELRSALGDMRRTVMRMSRLVNDLLTLARLDQGAPLSATRADLRPLIEEAVRTARSVTEDHPVSVDMTSPVSARADPDALHRVLLNLIDNAAKYSPPGTPIALRAGYDGDGHAVVEVQDRGPGIAPEDRGRIFERFYRAERSRARDSSSGAGLGLAICAALMARQGGAISVRETPGGGSTFVIALPTGR